MSLLLLLLALAVVGGVAAVAAGLITEGMDDPASSVPSRRLPPGPLTGDEVAKLRFVPALRGYRMDQVDAAMERLADEIDRLRDELDSRYPAPRPGQPRARGLPFGSAAPPAAEDPTSSARDPADHEQGWTDRDWAAHPRDPWTAGPADGGSRR